MLLLLWLLTRGGQFVVPGLGSIGINVVLIVIGTIFALACIKFGEAAEARFKGKDPRQVVADEVAGQTIALLFLPWVAAADGKQFLTNVKYAAIAFVMFRAFDIVKPPPAAGLQRLPGGLGILIDDIIAGIYALIATQMIVRWLLPAVGW